MMERSSGIDRLIDLNLGLLRNNLIFELSIVVFRAHLNPYV